MREALVILLLVFLQFLTGFGILSILKIYLRSAFAISLSVLLGTGVFSLIPFLLQLFYIPLTATNVFLALMVSCALLNIRSKQGWIYFFDDIKSNRFRIKLYELPFLLLIAFMVFVSAWRCYYYPPTPRDLTSGPEVIAEYAIKEKTMINSVFSLDLETTNNQFKPAFVTSLQIIYKYAGFPFGQVWLSTVFIFFLVFLYHALSIKLHRLFAGLLLVIFVAIPETYAYTIMVLFDYVNAVFFCLSLYYLFDFFKNHQRNYLILSGLLMALATYARSETLLLAGFIAVAIMVYHRRIKSSWWQLIKGCIIFLLPSLIIYLVSITIYINYYLPAGYKVESLLNNNLVDPMPLINRFLDMNGQIFFTNNGVSYYGYFIFIFVGLLLLDSIWKDVWDTRSLNWLYGVLVIYIGLPFIGYLFPLYDLDHSTKRGLFKILPLMLLYMANSRLLITMSERIRKWERLF